MSTMKRTLGKSGIEVSPMGMGCWAIGGPFMMFGKPDGWGDIDDGESIRAIHRAVDLGINFFDTAEAYPTTPATPENSGDTERIIGTWFEKRGKRDDIILATKVAGAGNRNIDEGAPVSAEKIRRACERSLQRLKTDYIDLYQIHWPNRGSYHFRQTWTWAPQTHDGEKARQDFLEALETMDALVKEGKIRHFGLSNETVWGTMTYLRMAEEKGLPRLASMQNEYSLLHRIFDLDFAELALREDVGLLAYTSTASGSLSGKYRGGDIPAGSRMTVQPNLNSRYTERSIPAIEAYLDIAGKHGLDPAQMAIAFALSRPFTTAVIIGATKMQQLKTDIAAVDLDLSDAVLEDIQETWKRFPLPL